MTKLILAVAGAALVVLGLGDLHRHRCASCWRSWWHFGRVEMGSLAAHVCPGCGRGPQWERA